MNKIYYITIHHMSFDDLYTTKLNISTIRPLYTGFAHLEDAREYLNGYLSIFTKIEHRNPKIYADSDGFTVDFYDDEDYVVETFSAQINTMHIR